MNWHDALDAQSEIARTWSNKPYMRKAVEAAMYEQWADHLFEEEQWRVRNAEPFFLSESFLKLVDHASSSFEPEPLLATDFITPIGFLYLETPYLMNPTPKLGSQFGPITIRVIKWATENNMGDSVDPVSLEDADSITISLYEDKRTVANKHLLAGPTFIFTGHHWWDFGQNFGEVKDAGTTPRPDTIKPFHRFFQTTLRLIRDQVAESSPMEAPRPSRKRANRAGVKPRTVNVVDLPRHRSSSSPKGSAVEWTHRWYVNGHWRNQWYPASETHRQRWVRGHVKGPDDAPFIPKQRVFRA
jgi:hypothetical protein